jgi:hypothetical protein
MPRPIRSIDIYLPLDYNDGHPIQESKYVFLEDEPLVRFGGVTSTQRQFPLRGIWRSESQVFPDRVVVFTVMDFRSPTDFEILRYLQRKNSSQEEVCSTRNPDYGAGVISDMILSLAPAGGQDLSVVGSDDRQGGAVYGVDGQKWSTAAASGRGCSANSATTPRPRPQHHRRGSPP